MKISTIPTVAITKFNKLPRNWKIAVSFVLFGLLFFPILISLMIAFYFAPLILGIVALVFIPKKFNFHSDKKLKIGFIITIILFSFIVEGVWASILPRSKVVETTEVNSAQEKNETKHQEQTTATSEASKSASQASESADKTNPKLYQVVSVTDGDTIKINIDGTIESVRLIGIDTPETLDPREPVQCFGKEASAKATEILDGKRVILEADSSQSERDKYNRLLRYIYLENGTFFNKFMLSEGYAHEYTYESNPYKYQTEFKEAEKQAREAGKGLWGANTCNGDTNKAAEQNSPSTVSSSGSTSQNNTSQTNPIPVPTPAPAPAPTPTITPSNNTNTTTNADTTPTDTSNSTNTSSSDSPQVKKSSTGICHEKGTEYYNRTKNYTPYDSIQSCLDSGGRLPK